jgi:hypothetical protein
MDFAVGIVSVDDNTGSPNDKGIGTMAYAKGYGDELLDVLRVGQGKATVNLPVEAVPADDEIIRFDFDVWFVDLSGGSILVELQNEAGERLAGFGYCAYGNGADADRFNTFNNDANEGLDLSGYATHNRAGDVASCVDGNKNSFSLLIDYKAQGIQGILTTTKGTCTGKMLPLSVDESVTDTKIAKFVLTSTYGQNGGGNYVGRRCWFDNLKAYKYKSSAEGPIVEYVLGDVNGDGAVDVSDYIGVANDILGIEQASFNKEAADVDKNGTIDVTDYLGVGNIIHTGSPFGNTDASRAAKKAATNPEDVDNVIYVESFQVEPGTTEATLSVQMKNTAEIRGFQFDLYLPEGVSVTVNAKGKIQGAALNENRLPEDDEHSLTSSVQADGAVRFLCGSQYQETFTGNSGELMTINVKLDEGMANGEYVIAIKNQKLSENDITKSYETELVESILTVGNATPTGINEVLTSQNTTNVVYDLQGRRVQNASKGLYILNGKKVVVK